MSKRVVYFNCHYVSESEACVSIFDSALMFGCMAFEITRTFAVKPFALSAHLQRLYASLRLLEIDCGLTIDQMERITLETLERNRPADMEWWIMHNVSRDPLGLYQTAFLGRLHADGLFCTSTSYSLVHGASFEGQTVGDGTPGPVLRKLTEAWKELAGVDFIAQSHDYAARLPEWETRQKLP